MQIVKVKTINQTQTLYKTSKQPKVIPPEKCEEWKQIISFAILTAGDMNNGNDFQGEKVFK